MIAWPWRAAAVVGSVAIPAQLWQERGALFGIVALLTYPPIFLLGAFAREWLLRPRPPGPRWRAPLGPLPIVPLTFCAAGLALHVLTRRKHEPAAA